jgi:hypothetical protein
MIPMPDLNTLEGYLGETASALIQMSALVLAGYDALECAEVSGLAGVASGLAGVMRTLAGASRAWAVLCAGGDAGKAGPATVARAGWA